MKKLRECSWCLKENIDNDMDNCCPDCVAEQTRKYSNKPVQGSWTRNAQAELNAHAKDVLQPLKSDGTINKHFVEAHGTKSIQKELKVSKKEILNNVERYG